MTKRFLPFLSTTMLASLALTACGGGGSGNNPAPSVPATATSNPGIPGNAGGSSSSTSAARQRLTGSALSVAGASVNISELASPAGAGLSAFQQALSIRRNAAASSSSPCENGVEFSWTSSGSAYARTLEIFYDAACASPYMLEKMNVAPPTGSSGNGTATGTQEVWNSGGTPISYKTNSYTFTVANNQVTQITQELTAAPAPNVSPFAQYGYTCIYGSPQAVDCGTANTENVTSLNESLGFTETTKGSIAAAASPAPSPSPGASAAPTYNAPSNLHLTIAGTGYTGALSGLTIAPGAAPAWNIAGGTQQVTLNGTIAESFSRIGLLSDVNLTLNDPSDNLTITLTATHGSNLNGSVMNGSGQAVGTIALDLSGSGTISYTDGSSAKVSDWVIL